MAYRIRPARGPEEDLAAIRLFGQGLYNWDPAELAKARTREELAQRFGLRMALREGHTVVVDCNGEIVAASRITPSPWGIRDPETGEIEHWETVAVHPNHRGKGLSEPLRREALATSDAAVVKSRIKDGNPKSWHVAEKLGFIRADEDDGHERIYVMRAARPALQSPPRRVPLEPTMKKNATAARRDVAILGLIKTAEPKFLEDTARSVGNWAQGAFGGGQQPGGTNWGEAAGKFWHDHGGKVMGGLGGLAAGALGGQFTDEDSSMRWLLPLLGAGVGVGGGALYDNPELMAKLKGMVGMRESDGAIKNRFAYRDEQNQQMNSPAYRAGTKARFPQGMPSPEQQGQNAGRQLQDWMKRRGSMAKVAAAALDSGARPGTKDVAVATPISKGVGPGGRIENNAGAPPLTKQAFFDQLVGAGVGALREKDPWEDRGDAVARSLGTGAVTGAGAVGGAGLGTLLGILAEAGIRKATGSPTSSGFPAGVAGAGLGAALGGLGGGVGAHLWSRRNPEKQKARLNAKLRQDPGLLRRGVPREMLADEEREQRKVASVTIVGIAAEASLSKVAGPAGLSDIDWTGIWDKNKNAIIGGGVGALAGGLGGGMMNGEDENGETHTGRNAGLGALAGAALGAGGGHFLDRDSANAAAKPAASAAAAAPPQSHLNRDLGVAGGGAIGLGAAAMRRPQLNGGARAPLSKAVLRALLAAGIGSGAGGLAGEGVDRLDR